METLTLLGHHINTLTAASLGCALLVLSHIPISAFKHPGTNSHYLLESDKSTSHSDTSVEKSMGQRISKGSTNSLLEYSHYTLTL